jgi:hypothetical protein
VRRAEAGERGHEVDAVVAVERRRERLGLLRTRDDPQPVAQPLHPGARHEHARLERVVEPLADPPGDRRDQPLLEQRRAAAGVLEQEVAGPVRLLPEPGRVAGLAVQRRLLAASGRVDLRSIVTGRYGLDDAEAALRAGRADSASVKVMVLPGLTPP